MIKSTEIKEIKIKLKSDRQDLLDKLNKILDTLKSKGYVITLEELIVFLLEHEISLAEGYMDAKSEVEEFLKKSK